MALNDNPSVIPSLHIKRYALCSGIAGAWASAETRIIQRSVLYGLLVGGSSFMSDVIDMKYPEPTLDNKPLRLAISSLVIGLGGGGAGMMVMEGNFFYYGLISLGADAIARNLINQLS